MKVEDSRKIELTSKDIEKLVIEELKTKGLIKSTDKSANVSFYLINDPDDNEYSMGSTRQIFGGCTVNVIKG